MALRDALRRHRRRPAEPADAFALDAVPLPARHHVARWRRQYACLAHRPTWLIETARGCPFRCSFCSIWQLHARSVRERSIDSVCHDFASAGDDIFVADDLFWYHPARSLALARELRRRGIRKQWILVQSRVDLVARHADLLEAWRPIARDFDIFFGLEAATNQGLSGLVKDATIGQTAQGIGVARSLNYGVTGNFVIDPAWSEADFERLWAFVEQHELFQAGFTILTPLPGTAYFDEMRPQLRARDGLTSTCTICSGSPRWDRNASSSCTARPGAARCSTCGGARACGSWLREVEPRNAVFLLRALRRTQRMMDPAHYLAEYDLGTTAEVLLGGRPVLEAS